MNEHARHDCVVVGAGLAGLTAAHELVAAGKSVVVLEARARVGGRTRSIKAGAGAVDLGASWFWPGEPLVHALAADLGVTTFPQALDGDALYEPDSTGVRRIGGNPIDVPAVRFTHGAQQLAIRLADRLPLETVRLGQAVLAVDSAADFVTVDTASTTLAADHVILALPPALAIQSIQFTPPLPQQVRHIAEATATWMGDVVKAVALYDIAFWRGAGLAGAAISHLGPFRELHDHAGPAGIPAAVFGFAPAGLFRDADADRAQRAFTDQLTRLFGPDAAAPHAVHLADWSREQHTSPHAPRAGASTATYGHRVLRQPTAGRLHWASTETSSRAPGHLEGALHAGTRAAHAVAHAPAAAGRRAR